MSKEKKQRLKLSTVFSIIQLLLFLSSTITSLAEKPSPLSYIALGLTVVFAIGFVASIFVNIRNNKEAKKSVSDTKYAVKTTKNVMSLIELGMDLITVAVALLIALDAYQNQTGGLKTTLAVIVAVFSLFNVVFSIVKKVKKMKKGAAKRDAKAQKNAVAEQKAVQQKPAQQKLPQDEPKKDQSKKPIKLNRK